MHTRLKYSTGIICIPIQLISATQAEMRLNRTLMEWSIPIQLISATLAEMRLKRKLKRSIPIQLISATKQR